MFTKYKYDAKANKKTLQDLKLRFKPQSKKVGKFFNLPNLKKSKQSINQKKRILGVKLEKLKDSKLSFDKGEEPKIGKPVLKN